MRAIKFFLPVVILSFSINSYAQVQWSNVLSGYAFQFIAKDKHGVLFTIDGSGKLYKSVDIGNTWIQIQSTGLMGGLRTIDFINDSTMLLAGSSATIMRTSDRGINWESISCSTCWFADDFTKIQMLTDTIGYVSGDQRIFKTTNSGLSFYDPFKNAPMSTFKAFFINENTGYSAALTSIFKTTDGALSWNQLLITSNHFNEGIWFASPNTGWVAGNNGYIHKTEDAGVLWSTKQLDNESYFVNIFGLNENLVWVAGKPGSIYSTIDGGNVWRKVNFPHNGYVNDILFLDNNTGFAASEHGLFKTVNASVNISSFNEVIPERFSLYQNFPNPFNPSTTFKIDIYNSDFITLKLFDLNGKEVAILLNEFLKPGTYEYNFNSEYLPSGIYFAVLSNGDKFETIKINLLK